MSRKRKITIATLVTFVVSLAAIITMSAIGASSAFAAGDAPEKAGGPPPFRNALTDEQKEQIAKKWEEKLAKDLADGKITQEQYDKATEAIKNGEAPFAGGFAMRGRGPGKGAFGAWGDGEFENRNADFKAAKEKWDALTDEQKAEIFGLEDQAAAIEGRIIDKYLEFGLIDAETAENMKNDLNSRKNEMRENGRMPMGAGGGIRWDHKGFGFAGEPGKNRINNIRAAGGVS